MSWKMMEVLICITEEQTVMSVLRIHLLKFFSMQPLKYKSINQ